MQAQQIDIPLTAFIIIAENETIEELDLSWNFFRRGSTLKLCEGISVNIFLTIEFKNSNSMNSNTKVALSWKYSSHACNENWRV